MRADVRHRNVFVGLGFGALALLGGARHAAAQIACNDASLVSPIYITGSTAFEPTAAQIGARLATQATPHTLVYAGTGSCDGFASIQNGAALTGTGHYYTFMSDGVTLNPAQNCMLQPTGATITLKADVGISDVFYEGCPNNAGMTLPAGFGDFKGPIQAMQFIVPSGNTTEFAISAEQAQDIWGCGMTSGVSPFTVPAAIAQRGPGSGTQIMISKYIGVPADMFVQAPIPAGGTTAPNVYGGGGALATAVAGGDIATAIGFVASDVYDTTQNRGRLRSLAFRGFKQTKAYFADSDPTKFDKQNVRDGHYMIFGPEHFIAAVATNGMPTNANAKLVIDWVQGNAEIVSGVPFGYVDIEAKAGMIPQCAMRVTRDADGGLLKPYKPTVSCSCYYESVQTSVSSANCVPCTVDADCTDPTKSCQTHFCEAK